MTRPDESKKTRVLRLVRLSLCFVLMCSWVAVTCLYFVNVRFPKGLRTGFCAHKRGDGLAARDRRQASTNSI
jgi:hypothetical protein